MARRGRPRGKPRQYNDRKKARTAIGVRLGTRFPWLRPRPKSLLIDSMTRHLLR